MFFGHFFLAGNSRIHGGCSQAKTEDFHQFLAHLIQQQSTENAIEEHEHSEQNVLLK